MSFSIVLATSNSVHEAVIAVSSMLLSWAFLAHLPKKRKGALAIETSYLAALTAIFPKMMMMWLHVVSR